MRKLPEASSAVELSVYVQPLWFIILVKLALHYSHVIPTAMRTVMPAEYLDIDHHLMVMEGIMKETDTFYGKLAIEYIHKCREAIEQIMSAGFSGMVTVKRD